MAVQGLRIELPNVAGNNVTGSTGNDIIVGGTSNDFLNGGTGNDLLSGGAGNDTLTGGAGRDTLTGGTGVDTFVVDAGSDTITDLGNGGADIVQVYAGATVNTVAYSDWQTTAATYNNGSATIYSNGHSINLSAATGSNGWTVTNDGNSTGVSLTGSAGANVLTGGSGNDLLNGGAGNDTLTGGAGADTLTGSTGNDTFVYTNPSYSLVTSFDTITDFSAIGMGTDLFKIGHTVSSGNFQTAATTGSGNLSTDLMTAVANNFASNCAALVTISGGSDAGSYAVVSNHSNGTAFLASTDAVIKVQSRATITNASFIV